MNRAEFEAKRAETEINFVEKQIDQLLEGHQTHIINRTSPPHYAIKALLKKGFHKITYCFDHDSFCVLDIKDDYNEAYAMIVSYNDGMRSGYRLAKRGDVDPLPF